MYSAVMRMGIAKHVYRVQQQQESKRKSKNELFLFCILHGLINAIPGLSALQIKANSTQNSIDFDVKNEFVSVFQEADHSRSK